MASLGRHITAAGLIVAAALVAGFAWHLAGAQDEARAMVRESLQRRTALTAALIGSARTTVTDARAGGDRIGRPPHAALHAFADRALRSALTRRGAQGYLLDGAGRVLSTTAPVPRPGAPAPAPVGSVRPGTTAEGRGHTRVAARVPASPWRVVLDVPSRRLYASVDGPARQASWLIFGGFAAAVCALVALGFAAVRRGRLLATARERERASRQLAHERLHDPLTGLPNRTLFEDRAKRAIRSAREHGRYVAVVAMDLDHFKRINESVGQVTGDAVLLEVARRLQGAVRDTDTVSRFGDDEFLILFEDIVGFELLRLVAAIDARASQPVALGDGSLPLSFSVGVAVLDGGDPHERTASELLQDADTAMYRAKDRGRGRVEVFDAGLQERAMQRLDQEMALRQAIGRGELLVHYQPIVRLPGGDIYGVEALVRWQRPGRGLVPPGDFIPLAEDTGLIADLGAWVLRQAVTDVAGWHRRGLIDDDFVLSVNVSARQLADPDLPAVVRAALGQWDRPPDRLSLELTETAVMADEEAATEMLDRLADLGVRLALDDFGAGHSSLGQLARSLPISMLKLDRSFVADIGAERDRGIVAAAAHLARALRLSCVAEGVETDEQAAVLAELGFDLAQGFRFGRPTDGEQLAAQLGRAVAGR